MPEYSWADNLEQVIRQTERNLYGLKHSYTDFSWDVPGAPVHPNGCSCAHCDTAATAHISMPQPSYISPLDEPKIPVQQKLRTTSNPTL